MNNKTLSDPHAEGMLIATCIINKAALIHSMTLTPDDFFYERNKTIFETMREMHRAGEEVDASALRVRLINSGAWERCGADGYIAEILSRGTTINLDVTINRILDLSKRRRLLVSSSELGKGAGNQAVPLDDICKKIELDLLAVQSSDEVTFTDLRDVICVDNSKAKCTPTGIMSVDNLLGGLYENELVCIAARPGCGKTTFILNVARNIAREKSVLFFSLEMSSRQLSEKVLAAEARVDSRHIRDRVFDDDEKSRVYDALNGYINQKNRLVVVDNIYDISQIINAIKKYHMLHDVDLVVIDYLQLVVGGDGESRYLQVGDMSRRLKNLAHQLSIPIVILSQLNRESEKRAGIPKMSELRESGNIEQDCDVIILIHKKTDGGDLEVRNDPTVNTAIIVDKNRSGSTGYTELMFDKRYSKFYEVSAVPASGWGDFGI